MGRREAKKDQKRTALIQAGMQLFEEQGFGPTTIDQITARADVAKGTFYNYFLTKEDLLVAGMLLTQEAMAAEAREGLLAPSSTRERFKALVRWTVAWVSENPELAVVWCVERFRRGCAQDGLSGWDKLLVQIVAEGQAEGHLRADRPMEFMVVEVSGMLVTYILTWYDGGRAFDLAAQMENAMEAYFEGNAGEAE